MAHDISDQKPPCRSDYSPWGVHGVCLDIWAALVSLTTPIFLCFIFYSFCVFLGPGVFIWFMGALD